MNGNSVYKIPDGKLVKIQLEFEKEKILAVKIFGDFFIYPEEGIEHLENSLTGKKLFEKEIIEAIEKSKSKNGLEFFGVHSTGLAQAILMAKEGAQK